MNNPYIVGGILGFLLAFLLLETIDVIKGFIKDYKTGNLDWLK